MPIDNFFRPDNRLLGSSTGDFSLYGGQPDHTISTARAADPMTLVSTPPTPGSDFIEHSSDTVNVPLPAPADAEQASVPPADIHDSVPAPAPHPAAQAIDVPVAISQSQGGSTAPGLIGQSTTADTVHPDGSSATASDLSGAQQPAPVLDTVPPVLAQSEALGTVTAQSAQTSAVIHDATGAIGSATDDILAAVTATHAGLADALAGVAGATDTLGATPVFDLDQFVFGGIDPGGGITTLVGMVQTSELFSVGPATAAPDAPDTTGSIINDLIGDAALVAPVLGEAGDHHADDAGIAHLGI